MLQSELYPVHFLELREVGCDRDCNLVSVAQISVFPVERDADAVLQRQVLLKSVPQAAETVIVVFQLDLFAEDLFVDLLKRLVVPLYRGGRVAVAPGVDDVEILIDVDFFRHRRYHRDDGDEYEQCSRCRRGQYDVSFDREEFFQR